MFLCALFIFSVSAADPFSMQDIQKALPPSEEDTLKKIASKDWAQEHMSLMEKVDIDSGYDNKLSVFNQTLTNTIKQLDHLCNMHKGDSNNHILQLVAQAFQALSGCLDKNYTSDTVILLQARGLLKGKVAQRDSSSDMDVD